MILFLGIEADDATDTSIAGAGNRGVYNDRAVWAFGACGDIERAQSLNKIDAIFLRADERVESAGGGINYGRADDAHVAVEILIVAAASAGHVRISRRNDIRSEKVRLPIWSCKGWVVGIERINRIVDG